MSYILIVEHIFCLVIQSFPMLNFVLQ